MSKHLTPLEVCERLIGKPETVAEASGLHKKSAFPWRHASKWREAGDLPSAKVQRALLAHSTAHRLGLTAEHLIWGAEESEIEDILSLRKLAEGARAIEAQTAGEGKAVPSFLTRRTAAA